jgi:tetratricopeptide (TPR) repeat protein
MIIWRGLGVLVLFIGFASLVLTEVIAEKLTGDDQFYQEHKWVGPIGLLIAAALTYGLHRLLLLQKDRVLIDKTTGEEVVLPSKHSLFFIPVQLWPITFVAFGLIAIVTDGLQTRVHANADTNQTQSRNLRPTAVYQKMKRADECGLRGDYPSAIRLATEVIDQQPSHARAHVLRGIAHRCNGEYALAIEDLDRAIQLDPRSSEAYTQRAFSRQQSLPADSPEQIMSDLNRAIELDANNAFAHVLRGNHFVYWSDLRAAIAEYDQALRLNPRTYSALCGRATVKYSLGQLDEARQDLQTALTLNPTMGERQQIEESLQYLKSPSE